jgi:hypothetical protein
MRFILVAVVLLMIPAVPVGATVEQHRGVLLLAEDPEPGPLKALPPAAAKAKIRQALDLIYRKSPLSARMIDHLRDVGTVAIQYDPQHAEASLLENRLAMFRTETGDPSVDRRTPLVFVAVLGRQVLNRDADELAGTIVHELAGHGTQHRIGRLGRMGDNDRECEARLFQLAAWQDLGVPQRAAFVVQFRRSLELSYCLEFRIWMNRRNHALANGFDRIEIEPLELVTAFRDYIDTVLGRKPPTSADW